MIDTAAPMRGRAKLTHGEVIAALVANRLSAPAPLYDVAGWASSAAVAELFGVPAGLLNDDRLGRALEALAPVAERVRGEVALAAASRLRGRPVPAAPGPDRASGSPAATPTRRWWQKGWAADRTIARQVRTLQASTPDGVAVYYRPHPGAPQRADLLRRGHGTAGRHRPTRAGRRRRLRPGHLGNLCDADRAGLRFVVPLRADTGWAAGSSPTCGGLDHAARPRPLRRSANSTCPPPSAPATEALLRDFEVTDPDTGTRHQLRVAYIWSSEEAASVADGPRTRPGQRRGRTRPASATAWADATTRPATGRRPRHQIIGPRHRRPAHRHHRHRRGKPTLTWHRDQTPSPPPPDSTASTPWPPTCPTHPAPPLTAPDCSTIYKDQWLVEQRHRDLKQTLHVRPVFLHNDDRITALIAVVGIALLIYGLIEADLRHALGPDTPLPGLLPEGRAASPTGRNILTAFDGLDATYTTTGLASTGSPPPNDHPRPPRHPPTLARNTPCHNNILDQEHP